MNKVMTKTDFPSGYCVRNDVWRYVLPAKRTILCVDDEPNVLHSTKLVLSTADYTVLTASNVADAIELMRTHTVDLILLDCLPDLCTLVNSAKHCNPDVRILIYSGSSETPFPEVDGFLLKPIAPGDLLRTLAALLDS
jgi:DNA-binding response OmpR family regulator